MPKLSLPLHEAHDLNWWLGRLDGAYQSGDSWKAKCPAHDDKVASLSISPTADGEVLVNCFAGCTYDKILKAVVNGSNEVEDHSPVSSTPGRTWWEEYTGIPAEEWESWGVKFTAGEIIFTWSGSQVQKIRRSASKDLRWKPTGAPAPPIWPYPEGPLPKRVYLCEGESDTGVLLHLGYRAYGVTKGAQTPLEPALHALSTLGVEEIVECFDIDPGGAQGVQRLQEACSALGLTLYHTGLPKTLNSFLGEKDLRDVWLRLGDCEELRENLEPVSFSHLSLSRPSLDQFLSMEMTEMTWLVDKVWLSGTIGLIVGSPKIGKTWMSLDLGVSIASGKPFLGTFPVSSPGPVALITKEDPDFLLQSRLVRILESKGLAGKVRGCEVEFAQPLPLYLDLTREFTFSPEEIDKLLLWLRAIRDVHGDLKMVIFDPILRMMEGVDEYKASEVGASVFSAAARIQRDLSSAVCLVHHRSKGGEGRHSYGSIAFHAFSENTLFIQGDQPDQEGWVPVEGEYKSAASYAWSYKLSNLENSYKVEVNQESPGKGDYREGILDVLDDYPDGATSQDIAKMLGAPEFLIRNLIKSLEQTGMVMKGQMSRWKLTQKGD